MTSLSDQNSVLMNLQSSMPATFNTKSAYEAGLVMGAPDMNKTELYGYKQDRTFASMFPPVCIKTHWDSEALSKYVLPEDTRIPLPVDPRPLVRNCTQYYTTAPVDTDAEAAARARGAAGLSVQPGGSASRGVPYEVFARNINTESDLFLNHPQDKCDDNKWAASEGSDLYNNNHAPPRTESNTFTELSRPIATIVPQGPYRCRAEADERAWERSPRMFNNVTRTDRVPGALPRHTEGPLTKRAAATGPVKGEPRVWPTGSVVFYVGSGTGGNTLIKLGLALRARGLEVTIFAPRRDATYEGLEYKSLTDFAPNDIYSNIIMWCTSELLANYQHRPICKALLMHVDEADGKDDVCQATVKVSADKIIVKSGVHRAMYDCYSWSKFEVIPDGLPVHLFTDIENRNLPREKFRVLVTEYTKPLLKFVRVAWPRIRAEYPGAELHIWASDADEKDKVMPLLAGTARGLGLVLHGKGSMNEMVRERFRSSVHVCLVDKDLVVAEGVRMSALAACIPIMPDRGVYTELRGVLIDGSVESDDVLIEYAKACSAVFKDDVYAGSQRRHLQSDEALKGWNATADRWITILNGLGGQTKPFSAGHHNSLFS